MKRVLLLLSLLLLSACSWQVVQSGTSGESTLAVMAAPTSSADLASLCQQKGFSWDRDNLCRYSETDERYSLELIYPIELLPNPLIESTIDNYFASIREEYLGFLLENEAIQPTASWYVSVTATVYRSQSRLVSLIFNENSYTGGSHTNNAYTSFTFDTSMSRLLSFADLFVDAIDPITSIAPIIRPHLQQALGDNGSTYWIEDGTNELSDFQIFALSDTDLIIVFPPEQVDSYVSGTHQVFIPRSELTGIIQDF